MDVELTGLCREHSFERAVDLCRRCGGEFCELCVVHPFGPKKPFCKECAMVQGGVRSFTTRPALPNRVIRKRVKAFEKRDAADVPGRAETPEVVDPVLADWLETAEIEKATPVADVAPPPAPVPVDTQAPPTPAAPAAAATELADLAVPTEDPADGEAPIDWSRPFG